MRLAELIESHIDEILEEWDAFAKSLGDVTSTMSPDALRDHAHRMLTAMVADMRGPQTAFEQEEKGKGHASPRPFITAAEIHGTGRHDDGFSLLQLTAEFRALRASVLRRWVPTIHQNDLTSIDELIRFNEALDQALAESVSTFSRKAEQTRDVFLAMLGHDLRSPLNTIGLTSEYFERPEVEKTRRLASAHRIRRSVATMSAMVNDLLEFSRLQLGGAIPVVRTPGDLAEICRRAVDDAIAAHPSCTFRLEAPPAIPGDFDADRLAQVFGNLLNNAAQYRSRGTTVTLTAAVDGPDAVVHVHNFGSAIPEAQQATIFDPLIQLNATGADVDRPRSSAGLGLFIARQIVEAHGGTPGVASEPDTGTTFTARLTAPDA